jgi:hypothetical protein
VNKVIITLTIEVPDGVVPDVQYTTEHAQNTPYRATVIANNTVEANRSDAEPPLAELPPPQSIDDDGPLGVAQRVFHEQTGTTPEWKCPEHGTPAKLVPGGVAASSGKAYTAFEVCSTAFCKQKPPKRRAA